MLIRLSRKFFTLFVFGIFVLQSFNNAILFVIYNKYSLTCGYNSLYVHLPAQIKISINSKCFMGNHVQNAKIQRFKCLKNITSITSGEPTLLARCM